MTIIRKGREYVDEEEYQDERSEYMRPEYYEKGDEEVEETDDIPRDHKSME